MRNLCICLICVVVYLTGCAHVRAINIRTSQTAPLPATKPLNKVSGTQEQREKIAAMARKTVGKSRVENGNHTYRADCSGTVRGIYALAGYPLGGKPYKGENDVTTLYRYIYNTGAIYEATPLPGDLIFFHDTLDPKGARDYEDRLTHVGIVDAVLGDGTVAFIHHLAGKIITSYMNLRYPEKRNKTVDKPDGNSGIRRPGQGRSTLTTAQLFAGYGRVAL